VATTRVLLYFSISTQLEFSTARNSFSLSEPSTTLRHLNVVCQLVCARQVIDTGGGS